MSDWPEWFSNKVASGLQGLTTLNLAGHPPADALKVVGEVWLAALWHHPCEWVEQLDAHRIEIGFRHLAAKVIEWPAPRQLLDEMPRRSDPARLPAPPPSAEEREATRRQIETYVKQELEGRKLTEVERLIKETLERVSRGL